jgi:hypothetical protein
MYFVVSSRRRYYILYLQQVLKLGVNGFAGYHSPGCKACGKGLRFHFLHLSPHNEHAYRQYEFVDKLFATGILWLRMYRITIAV